MRQGTFSIKKFVRRTVLALLLAGAAALTWSWLRSLDTLFWPTTGQERIEEMASILRRIRGGASWCIASRNPKNVYVFIPHDEELEFGRCMSALNPASDYIAEYNRADLKRFYRSTDGDKFCEVTLMTRFGNEEQIVGADCYFGLFRKSDDTGIGMTDDD